MKMMMLTVISDFIFSAMEGSSSNSTNWIVKNRVEILSQQRSILKKNGKLQAFLTDWDWY